MNWSKCKAGGAGTYINLHTHDPVNTCAADSMWNCPPSIGTESASAVAVAVELLLLSTSTLTDRRPCSSFPLRVSVAGQGFEPLGCYGGGVGGTTSSNIASLAACAALCASTATE